MTPGERFHRFCETYLRQSKGQYANVPLKLEEWQLRDFAELLEEDERGVRQHREGALWVARKNGKSTISAALALYMLCADGEPGAEVISAASSRDQAAIVFNEAKSMVERSPLLSQYCKVYRREITCGDGHGGMNIYRVISSDAPRQHGLNPSAVIIDELHAHEDDGELYYALRTAGLMRRNFLLLSISTAGYDYESIAGEIYLRGQRRDPTLWSRSYEVADGDVENRDAWKAANPSSWITTEMLEREAASLPRFVFERLHLNRWTSAEAQFIQPAEWHACRSSDAVIPDHSDIWVGVDLGLKFDTAAVAWVDKDLRCDSYVWGLQRDGARRSPPAHEIIDAESLEIKDVEDFILNELGLRYRIREIVYDPYRFERSAQELKNAGFWVAPFEQKEVHLVAAAQAFFESVNHRRYKHDGDPVLTTHILNAAAVEREGGIRMSKKRAKRAMDAAMALAMATSARIDSDLAGQPHAEAVV